MKKIILSLYFLSGLMLFNKSFAQEAKPVHFSFNATAVGNAEMLLTIKAKMDKGTQLFATHPQKKDDPFMCSLTLDSTANMKFKISEPAEEIGSLKKVNADADSSSYFVYTDSVAFIYHIKTTDTSAKQISGSFNWLAKSGAEFPSSVENFSISIESKLTAASVNSSADKTKSNSLWHIFLICFGTGLLAIITPCVFPLIPVTVSFFLKRSKSRVEGIRNAVWYSFSIILIYTIPTLLLTLIFGDKILYTISTHPVSNILFFLIFIVFAISFFGAFELNLPNSWANKADQNAGKGGLLGIFFMAMTLVIVSFSCTGPLVGTLLGQTSTNGVSSAPIIGMLGFGMGLALPFSLFAFFPSMMHSLPKSGGWLNTVKVTFGFIELALAMKFLSNVDLVYHWHLLDRDVFLVCWIVIFGLMGYYLLGKLKFSHDSDLPYLSVPRLFFSIFAFSFSLYMIPGLWGAPLNVLSGFIPPATTQDFNLEKLQFKLDNLSGNISSKGQSNSNMAAPPKRYTNILEVPFGLKAYFDLKEGMAAAKALNKPIMLDFTGHSCANCRKMEEQVWKNPEVLKRIKENFVLVSLYVDESTELPLEEQIQKADGQKLTTVGAQNLDYEITKFGFNAQPLYKFIDLNGNPLSDINYGYDPDADKFIQHLDAMKAAFDKQKIN